MDGYLEDGLSPYALVVNHRTGKYLPILSPEERLKTVWIYGLFDVAGFCHYAGQTKYPKERSSQHWKNKPGLQFRVLRSTSEQSASRIEIQVIKAFWKKGQCKLNTSALPFNGRIKTPRIYSEVAKRSFTSVEEACLYFNYCSKSISDQIKGIRNYNGLRWLTEDEIKSSLKGLTTVID